MIFDILIFFRHALLSLRLQNQILAKDVITCDDALYALREQIDNRKMEAKMADLARVFKLNTSEVISNFKNSI